MAVNKKTAENEIQKVNVENVHVPNLDDATIINGILNDGTIDLKTKLVRICESNTKYANLAKSLKQYQEQMSEHAVLPTREDGAAINYNLYAKLISVCEESVYSEFKIKFDIVNLVFLLYKNDAYSEFKLFRFSNDWKYGTEKYKTYRAICIIICILCDFKTRAEELRKISFTGTLTQEGTKFTETSINNIRRYYVGG